MHKTLIGNYFNFIGTFNLTTDFETKQKVHAREINSQKNKSWKGKELAILVKHDTQSQVVRIFGGLDISKPIDTLSINKDDKGKSLKLQIPQSKRFDEEVIKNVSNFKKFKLPKFKMVKRIAEDAEVDIKVFAKKGLDYVVINQSPLTILVGSNKVVEVNPTEFSEVFEKQVEFITEIDAIDFIENNLLAFEGKEFKFSGQLKLEAYDGKVMQKFYINSIYDVYGDISSKDKGFNGHLPILFDKDIFDKDYIKNGVPVISEKPEDKPTIIMQERKIPISVYVSQYKDSETNLYFPVKAVIKLADKFDFFNETHMKKLNFLLETLTVKNKKKVYEIGLGVRYFKGTEDSVITMDDLSNFEKRQIELGFKTFEALVDKKAKSEKINEIQVKLDFHEAYVDGVVETDLTEDDLIFIAEEKKEEPKQAKKEAKVEVVEEDEDLF